MPEIPLDMIDQEASKDACGTVVSVRNMMILLGASDEELQEHDRVIQLRTEILEREPWRDKRTRRENGTWPNGKPMIVIEGKIDWSGTEMQEIVDRSIANERSKPKTIGRKVNGNWVCEVIEWNGEKWVAIRHADMCECPDCQTETPDE